MTTFRLLHECYQNKTVRTLELLHAVTIRVIINKLTMSKGKQRVNNSFNYNCISPVYCLKRTGLTRLLVLPETPVDPDCSSESQSSAWDWTTQTNSAAKRCMVTVFLSVLQWMNDAKNHVKTVSLKHLHFLTIIQKQLSHLKA